MTFKRPSTRKATWYNVQIWTKRNCWNLYVVPTHHERMPTCTQMTLVCIVTASVIKTVSRVQQVRRTARNDERQRYFPNDMLGARSIEILQSPLILKLLIARNDQHISFSAEEKREEYIQSFTLQPLLYPSTGNSESRNIITITNCQGEATLAHSHKASKIQIVDRFGSLLRNGKSSRITQFLTMSNRPLEKDIAIMDAKKCRKQRKKKKVQEKTWKQDNGPAQDNNLDGLFNKSPSMSHQPETVYKLRSQKRLGETRSMKRAQGRTTYDLYCMWRWIRNEKDPSVSNYKLQKVTCLRM